MSPRGGSRLGSGRPKKLEEPVNFTIRIEKELIEKAREAAWAARISLSDLVRETFERLVSRSRADASPQPKRARKKPTRS